jgi:hypothetical protein
MPEIVLRHSGELIDLKAAAPSLLGALFHEIDNRATALRSDKRELSDELARRLDHEGRRTVEIDGWKFEVNAPTERQIDARELQVVLRELVAEGTLSQEKADRCIEWEPKVIWREVKPLTTDPRCKERINHTINEAPAARYVKARKV